MQMTPAKSGAPTVSIALTSTLINLWSGLAFVPMARFPVYCATQAAIHSETMSLRHQLRSSGVKVVELIPPYVATELGGAGKTVPAGPPQPVPLEAFIPEAMRGGVDRNGEAAFLADEPMSGQDRVSYWDWRGVGAGQMLLQDLLRESF